MLPGRRVGAGHRVGIQNSPPRDAAIGVVAPSTYDKPDRRAPVRSPRRPQRPSTDDIARDRSGPPRKSLNENRRASIKNRRGSRRVCACKLSPAGYAHAN